jgi:hypothetical protein
MNASVKLVLFGAERPRLFGRDAATFCSYAAISTFHDIHEAGGPCWRYDFGVSEQPAILKKRANATGKVGDN